VEGISVLLYFSFQQKDLPKRHKGYGCHEIQYVEGFYTPFNVHQIMGKIFPNSLSC
jgi:hypothetical protein